MKNIKLTILLLLIGLFISVTYISVFADCTTFMIGKDASVDGSTMLTIHQDTPTYDPRLTFIPAKDHAPGTMKRLYDYPQYERWWDGYGNWIDAEGEDKLAAIIPEVPHTNAYMRGLFGVMNEYQVSMGMPTLAAIYEELANDQAKLRLTQLSYVALERAKTAREAIQIMGSLAEEFGFKGEYTPGKGLSVGDPNEVWLFHIMGPGPYWEHGSKDYLGAIWLAQRIPDDHVGVFPNGFSIQEVDFEDTDNFMYSSNLKSFAVEMGWFDEKSGEAFNALEVYTNSTPQFPWGTPERQWRAYQFLAPSLNLPNPDEILTMKGPKGYPYRYPFSVKVEKKISAADLMGFNRDHLEGTYMDLTQGPLAGPFGIPTRTMGTYFKVGDEVVVEARAIQGDSTQYTEVCQMRSWLPNDIGGVIWWAPGRPNTSVYVPLYCGINSLTEQLSTGNHFEMEWGKTGYWAATFVNTFSNVMYSEIIKDVRRKQSELEGEALAMLPVIDKIALDIYESDEKYGPMLAKRYITEWSNQHADNVIERYWDFANSLIVKYHHRYVNEPALASTPKMPNEEYWLNLALEYQKEVRGRIIK